MLLARRLWNWCAVLGAPQPQGDDADVPWVAAVEAGDRAEVGDRLFDAVVVGDLVAAQRRRWLTARA